MTQLSTLNKYFLKYRYRFILGIFFVILTNYFRILSPQLTGFVINTGIGAIRGVDTSQASADYKNYDVLVRMVIDNFNDRPGNKILFAGIMLILLALLSGLFMFLMRQTIIVMSRHIEFDQKNEVFNHYQQLDAGFYKTHATGDLMNRIAEDVSRVRMYTGPAIMYFINLAAIIGFSISFMLKSDPRLTLITLCPLPVLAIAIYFVNTIINKKSEKIQRLLSDLTTNAQESYSGIRVIKSFVQEQAMTRRFQKNSEEYRKNALSLAKTEAIYFPSMGLLIGLSTLITIMAGALDVVNNVPGATVGKIAEFVMYIQMLTFPVSAIGWTASMTQRAVASQKRINEFLMTAPLITSPAKTAAYKLKGEIEFKNVTFTYAHTGVMAIRDVSVKINAGERIAIVGKTGSGKSTLAQLLLRSYDPQAGKILMDSFSNNTLDPEVLRRNISYVPQDVFLFSESIENNIRFGNDQASIHEVAEAARKAGIEKEINSFPENYQTLVGERGVTLSGGQKQRISIARAILKDAPIVLFDDCLSAVDSKTENEITDNLKSYLNNKTSIIITHRIFNSLRFDKIIVMDEGTIIETGTHEQLLSRNGVYAEIFSRQLEAETQT